VKSIENRADPCIDQCIDHLALDSIPISAILRERVCWSPPLLTVADSYEGIGNTIVQ
jgi:hypothetical protein